MSRADANPLAIERSFTQELKGKSRRRREGSRGSGIQLSVCNLMVWAKTNAGMGSLYRSTRAFAAVQERRRPERQQHRARQGGPLALERMGLPRPSSLGSDARRGLKDHPTVKPTAMLEDALLDLTNRGEIVLDPFLGSGSTLIAADRAGRVCRGVELDPLYVDVIIRRYEAATGKAAILIETGETFRSWRRGGRRTARADAGGGGPAYGLRLQSRRAARLAVAVQAEANSPQRRRG